VVRAVKAIAVLHSSQTSPETVKIIQLFAFVTMLQIAGALPAQQQEIGIDSRVCELPTDKLGPFVHTADDKVLAIDSESTYISDDDGRIHQSWVCWAIH
jgi:hypothetical protein